MSIQPITSHDFVEMNTRGIQQGVSTNCEWDLPNTMNEFDIACPSCGDKTQVALEEGAEPVRIKPGAPASMELPAQGRSQFNVPPMSAATTYTSSMSELEFER